MFFNRNTRKSYLFLDTRGLLGRSTKTTWSYHPSRFNSETCPVHKKGKGGQKFGLQLFIEDCYMDGWMETCAWHFPPSSDHLFKHASHAIQNNFYSCGPDELLQIWVFSHCSLSHINTWTQNMLHISICYNLYLPFINERCHGSSGNCTCETVFSPAEDSWIDSENQHGLKFF